MAHVAAPNAVGAAAAALAAAALAAAAHTATTVAAVVAVAAAGLPPVDCQNYEDNECKIKKIVDKCRKKPGENKCLKRCNSDRGRKYKEPRCQKTCCELGFTV